MLTESMRATWELYVKAWSTADSDERSRLLQESLAPTFRYVDPVSDCRNLAELVEVIERFQNNFPGLTIASDSWVEHHDRALAHWRVLDAGGVTRLPGVDALVFNADGLIEQVTGFFELPPANS